jgi:hypothetical protein
MSPSDVAGFDKATLTMTDVHKLIEQVRDPYKPGPVDEQRLDRFDLNPPLRGPCRQHAGVQERLSEQLEELRAQPAVTTLGDLVPITAKGRCQADQADQGHDTNVTVRPGARDA